MFHWDGHSLGRGGGGPFFVPRQHQGTGRHDAPDAYGAWYCARQPIAAVAERIQNLRGQTLTNVDFRRLGGLRLALVGFRLKPSLTLVNLDDPAELYARALRPSRVTTPQRPITQATARAIFQEGAAGVLWWSTLVADWTNVTLFHERAMRHASIVAPPRLLSTAMAEVQEASEVLGVRLGN